MNYQNQFQEAQILQSILSFTPDYVRVIKKARLKKVIEAVAKKHGVPITDEVLEQIDKLY